MKPCHVIGFVGTQLDGGLGAARWDKWRPSVALTMHDDWQVDMLTLFYPPASQALADTLREDIARTSPRTQVQFVPMALANPWDFGEVYATLYDWVRAQVFDTTATDHYVHITTGTHVAQICLFLLVETRFIPAKLLQTAPPRRQHNRAPGTYEVIDLDLSRYDAINARLSVTHADAVTFLKSGIATRNARFNRLVEEIEAVAMRSTAPILLTGPTGAGKSMLAKRIFELKKSRHQVEGAFVDVNCATLRGDGAASALFGHIKGAYTGAQQARAGLLRAAHQGVLFLDEIGELGLDEQAMLLKGIEEKRFLPVGADSDATSDFQLIAGTNRNLRDAVAEGRFREDLFARINLWAYDLPGLAERREDIAPNIDHQLAIASRELKRQVRFTTEARDEYLHFATADSARWTGNFRDLAASVTRLATLADHGRIGIGQVRAECARLEWQWGSAASAHIGTQAGDAHQMGVSSQRDLRDLLGDRYDSVDQFDKLQLVAVIDTCRRTRSLSDAGRALFNVSRNARSVINDADRLRKYLAKFGLTWERAVG
jgi:transcriptional regulatory protein RtcR